MPSKIKSPTITTYRVVDEAEPTKMIVSCKTLAEAEEKKAEQEKKDKKHGNKRSLTVVEHGREAKRGRDLKNLDFKWENPVYLDTWKEGYDFVLLNTDNDVRLFGETMRHCATYPDRRKAATENKHFFMTILDPKGQPLLTAHAKHADYLGKVPITMYDTGLLSLGWGVEYEDSPEPQPFEAWSSERRKAYETEYEKSCRLYNTTYGYGRGWYEERYPKSRYVDACCNEAAYERYCQDIRRKKPVKGYRPSIINGFPVVMLSCYERGYACSYPEAVKWIEEWYIERLDLESPLRKWKTPDKDDSDFGY